MWNFLNVFYLRGKRFQSSLTDVTTKETSQRIVEQSSSQVVNNQSSEQRRNTKARKAKLLGSNEIDSQHISFNLVEGNRDIVVRKTPIILQVEDDPKTYKEVMASTDANFWKDALKMKWIQ